MEIIRGHKSLASVVRARHFCSGIQTFIFANIFDLVTARRLANFAFLDSSRFIIAEPICLGHSTRSNEYPSCNGQKKKKAIVYQRLTNFYCATKRKGA